jgi:GNAT superfamily N-acetyltransferase
MVATEVSAIVRLKGTDAADGLVLSSEANWNQTEADWRFFLEKGIVFGIRDPVGRLVASAALLPFGGGNASISMVLVTASWRRRGLASCLVDRCLAVAAELKLATWLDATPAGAAVYGPLGFVPTLELWRLRFQPGRERQPVEAPLSCALAELIARDRCAVGFDRRTLLNELGARAGSRTLSNGEAVALIRDGRSARHIGPLFGANVDGALALVDSIAGQEAGALLLDAVVSQEDFVRELVERGWNIERPFQRMRFGDAGSHGHELPFAVAGPEYG